LQWNNNEYKDLWEAFKEKKLSGSNDKINSKSGSRQPDFEMMMIKS
jgi:hypothetical protein